MNDVSPEERLVNVNQWGQSEMPAANDQPNMITVNDVEQILDNMLAGVCTHIQGGRREKILNERFLDHMFSCEVGKVCERKGVDLWQNLVLEPECPTGIKFRRDAIDLDDPDATARNAIGKGKAGNFDFRPMWSPICVEWKGPKFCGRKDFAEAFLKLLTQDLSTIKVFAAIITSSKSGRADHRAKVPRRLTETLAFMKEVRRVESFQDHNRLLRHS